MKQAASETSVRALVEFELVKLAESINVSGNLTDGQISAIARGIVEDYPNETIADFKICFTKAAKGDYGKVWKLDGVEIGTWIKAYLEQKYEVLEEGLKNSADEQKNKVFEGVRSGADWYQLWQEAIALDEKPVKTQSANLTMLNNLRAMTDKEMKKKGQEVPERNLYPMTSRNELLKKQKHMQWILENFDARTGEKNPTFIDEETWNATNI